MKLLACALSILFSTQIFANIADYSDISASVRPAARKLPRNRYPLRTGRIAYIIRTSSIGPKFVKAKILSYDDSSEKVRVEYLDYDPGKVSRTSSELVTFDKGCINDLCVGDGLRIGGQVAIKAKLFAFSVRGKKGYEQNFIYQVQDDRVPHMDGKLYSSSGENLYTTYGCGEKKLCVGDTAFFLNFSNGRLWKSDVLGKNFKGEYLMKARKDGYLFNNTSYKNTYLVEENSCGKGFCFRDVVFYNKKPRTRAFISGINSEGRYLITYLEGRDRGRSVYRVRDGSLKK